MIQAINAGGPVPLKNFGTLPSSVMVFQAQEKTRLQKL
jgi:hypothetical protein